MVQNLVLTCILSGFEFDITLSELANWHDVLHSPPLRNAQAHQIGRWAPTDSALPYGCAKLCHTAMMLKC
eukprot:scaffold69965_cov19-Prasinocladus_malaysianus.AAC.1